MKENISGRFAGLDLLRGVAALSVLLMHCWTTPSSWSQPLPNFLPRAYLAVDLFFVLSGFVIGHAYDHRLDDRTQLKQYCLARVIRLYPFYLVATLMAAAEMLAAAWIGHNSDPDITFGRLSTSLATALMFLPTPAAWSVWPPFVFPLVFTAWSLLWELLVNLLYGFAARRFRGIALAAPIAFGGLGICVTLFHFGSAEPGGYWHGWWVGGARALFSFFVGVALFQLRTRHRPPPLPLPTVAAALLVAFVPSGLGGLYDLACMVILFPLLVWLGAEASMGPRLRKFALFAGFLAYPVYLLQAPLIWALPPLTLRLNGVLPSTTAKEVAVGLYPVIIIAAGWVIARWFDSPIRERLRHRLLNRPPELPAQAAP